MAESSDNRPTIIKRKKVVKGGGHHGGAWKVAYADFVTAMMAFFLLMWLLNATTEQQRKGLADYFNPTIPVFRVSGGGEDVFGGKSIFSQENRMGNTSDTPDTEGSGEVPKEDAPAGPDETGAIFAEIENLLRGDSGESMVADQLLQHVATRVTDEGLIIELFDLEGSPLFVSGSMVPTPVMEALLAMVAEVIGIVSNEIAISGNTDSRNADGRDAFILSSNRAQLARQRLLSNGIPDERIRRVTGNADRLPVSPDASVFRNRRIEITLLRRLSGKNTNN